jgi:3',5'-nucleoside bisphosphate phosphatase
MMDPFKFGLLAAAACLSASYFWAAAAPPDTLVRDPLPVPNLPGFRTLKGDFHTHTVFSDGEVWPSTRVVEAWTAGLDVIALTDHAGTHPHRQDLSTDLKRPYEIAQPTAERLGMILIQGVEIAEGNLHCNALFVTDPNVFTGRPLLDALRRAKSQGAFVFWNHPGWKRKPEWFPLIASAYDEHLFQGAELVNTLDFYPEAYPWFAEKRLTIMADSDVHAPAANDYLPRTRPITLLFVRTADSAGVREALDFRRTAAWMGGQVWGPEEYLSGLWKGAIKLEDSQLHFTAAAPGTVLRLRNESAFPFKLQPVGQPEWFGMGGAEIAPGVTFGIPVSIAKTAPLGISDIELQFEVTNFHVAPDRQLVVKLQLRVNNQGPG